MNQYVTQEYYFNEFGGTTLPDAEISKYLKLAQEKIDDVTFNRIVGIGFDNLTDFQKECVSKAVCYQAEYYFENGTSSLSNVSSYEVLDISITMKEDTKTEAQKLEMSEFAYMNIKKSGLASRVL